MRVEFEVEARLELRQAARWYEGKKDGLGHEFMAEVRRSLDAISAHPTRWPKLTKLARRYRLDRFPYWIVYHERAECVSIIAVMHQSSPPELLETAS